MCRGWGWSRRHERKRRREKERQKDSRERKEESRDRETHVRETERVQKREGGRETGSSRWGCTDHLKHSDLPWILMQTKPNQNKTKTKSEREEATMVLRREREH